MYPIFMNPISQMVNLYFSILFTAQVIYTPHIHGLLGVTSILSSLLRKRKDESQCLPRDFVRYTIKALKYSPLNFSSNESPTHTCGSMTCNTCVCVYKLNTPP